MTLHRLANVYPPEIRSYGDILSICRLSAKDNTLDDILSMTKSKLQISIRACITNLCGRSVIQEELTPLSFKKNLVHNFLQRKFQSKWESHLRIGQNSEGLISLLDKNHFEKNPVPLNIHRAQLSHLCSLLTGQAN